MCVRTRHRTRGSASLPEQGSRATGRALLPQGRERAGVWGMVDVCSDTPPDAQSLWIADIPAEEAVRGCCSCSYMSCHGGIGGLTFF